MPPTVAIRLIAIGALKPCQIARLYAGIGPPTTGRAAASSAGPIDAAGAMPTIRQMSTSSSIGTRIHRAGSWGSRGRPVGAAPKKTP